MFLSEANVAWYNLLTDFEINYADPLVMPAGKEANCGATAVSPDYLANTKINKMFSTESLIYPEEPSIFFIVFSNISSESSRLHYGHNSYYYNFMTDYW